MIGAGLGVFAAFAVLGLFSSLVPTFLHGILGVHNLALIGGASFLIFIIAAISQAVSAQLPARRSVSTGVPLLLACLLALELALFLPALWLFVIGIVAGGVAVGFIFRGGLSELNRLAEPRHRAAVVSAFFVIAYVGLGLPAVLAGLISVAVGPVDASGYVAALVAAVVVVAFVVVRRAFGSDSSAAPPDAPSDSWCQLHESAHVSDAATHMRGLSTSSGTAAPLICPSEVISAGVMSFSVQSASTRARFPDMLTR
jgi:MFS family permease